jgi:hypothetical protein
MADNPSDDDILSARGGAAPVATATPAPQVADDDILKARGITTPAPITQPPTQGQAIANMSKELYAGYVRGLADSPQLQDIKNSALAKMAPPMKGLEGLPLPLEEDEFQKQYGNSTAASFGRFAGHLSTTLPLMWATAGAANPLTAPGLTQVPGQAITAAPAIAPWLVNAGRNAMQAAEFSGGSGDTPGQNLVSAGLGAAFGPIGSAAKYAANSGMFDAFLNHPVTQAVAGLGAGAYGALHGGSILPALEWAAGGAGASHLVAKLAPVGNLLLRTVGSVLAGPAGPVVAGAAAPVVGPLGSDIANDLIPGM